jgi:hypothetical protein
MLVFRWVCVIMLLGYTNEIDTLGSGTPNIYLQALTCGVVRDPTLPRCVDVTDVVSVLVLHTTVNMSTP